MEPTIGSSGIVNVNFGVNCKVMAPVNLYGCRIGDNVFVGPFVEIQNGVTIGNNCKIQSHSFICEMVTIGSDCFIGHGVMFINDVFENGQPAGGDKLQWKITMIGNQVSIGSNATILPVSICSNVVIGAGAVVTKNIEKPGVYAGNPARFIKDFKVENMPGCLLTGANGFLGRYIYDVLQQSWQVDTLGLNPRNNYTTDLSKDSIELNHSYDLVVHAAAKSNYMGEKDADLFFQINRDGSKRICEAFDRLAVYPKQFVFISSVAVYGAVHGKNIKEEYPLNGETAYAKSKIEAEEFIESWCREHGIVCTILRSPLIAGQGAPGNIAKMVDAIRKNRFFIIGKGDAQKSMVLPQDIAEFIPAVAAKGGVYNLAGEDHPSIAEFAENNCKPIR
jgi:nucleoside-diphosphate-sugar epimerase/acetyltransferase-like isoleucine patch superfamily enzyme